MAQIPHSGFLYAGVPLDATGVKFARETIKAGPRRAANFRLSGNSQMTIKSNSKKKKKRGEERCGECGGRGVVRWGMNPL